MKKDIIFVDGSTEGSKNKIGHVKEVGLGVYIRGNDKWCMKVDGISNNDAEMKAMIWGLKLALEQGLTDVIVYSDSLIAVNRANGRRPIGKYNNDNMNHLQDILSDYSSRFNSIEFIHTSRNNNKIADKLSRIATSLKKKREVVRPLVDFSFKP